MKPAPFDYQAPGTLREAIAPLASNPEASVIAGGQSLMPVLVIKQEDAGEGEIALTPGIFSQGPAPAARPFRQVQLGDDLVRRRSVDSGPVKKSRARTVRDPAGPRRVISPSQVTAMPGNSAAGSAWARLPPTVPRLRI
jgi:hypothetical protein